MKTKSSNKTVSICIPAYKAEEFIEEALQSIADQSYPHWEVIVVEDGSKDRTEEVVAQFDSQNDNAFIYLRHEKNQHQAQARNTAMARAEGEIFAFLDADDYWSPNHLQSCIDVLENGYDAAFSNSQLFEHETGELQQIRGPSDKQISDLRNSLYRSNFLQPSGCLLLAETARKVGEFDTQFFGTEDIEYWFRLLQKGAKFGFTREATCFYRKHANATTSLGAHMVEAMAWVYQKHFNWTEVPIELRKEMTNKTFHSAGRMILRSNPRRARTLFVKAWQAKKASIKDLLFAMFALPTSLFKSQTPS